MHCHFAWLSLILDRNLHIQVSQSRPLNASLPRPYISYPLLASKINIHDPAAVDTFNIYPLERHSYPPYSHTNTPLSVLVLAYGITHPQCWPRTNSDVPSVPFLFQLTTWPLSASRGAPPRAATPSSAVRAIWTRRTQCRPRGRNRVNPMTSARR